MAMYVVYFLNEAGEELTHVTLDAENAQAAEANARSNSELEAHLREGATRVEEVDLEMIEEWAKD